MTIGIDIGGTKCAVVLADEEARIVAKRKFPTAEYDNPETAVAALSEHAKDLLLEHNAASELEAVGVSCGGPLDSDAGLILSPPNLPGWDRVPVVSLLAAQLGVPVFLQNDANAGALAEWLFGAGRGYSNLIFLTFGTGMGAGLILGDRLYAGTNDLAGEIGHVRLTETGPVGYGKAGSFEGYCSGAGIARTAGREAREVVEAARRGDRSARAILDKSGRYLGRGIAILVDVLNPELIIIGGIYARAAELFSEPMHRTLREEALPGAIERCEVAPAALGEAIGDYAALSVALYGLGRVTTSDGRRSVKKSG
ncbi:MAG: ROK family protein [Spirochaetaceae bacterium]